MDMDKVDISEYLGGGRVTLNGPARSQQSGSGSPASTAPLEETVEDPGYSILLGYGFRSGKRILRRKQIVAQPSEATEQA
jgi:hypothetical protein